MDHFEIRVRGDGTPTSGHGTSAPAGPDAGGPHHGGAGDDEAIGRRLQAGEPAALGELYRLHRRRAFGLAYRVLGDGAAAEDAVQAAFLALWERASRLDPRGGRIESLLMTIVHRRAVDLVRARPREGAQLAPAGGSGLPERAPLDSIVDERSAELFERIADDRAELRARLQSALAALPEEQREVVELAYFDGLTHREIAQRLALPSGTVKSRLRLAMHKLREAIPMRGAE